ncbi:MAG: SLC13 family permease [Anaerolineales bacterium]|nr:SLC13 family permease [Anaerolineales bacterium]
MGLPEIITLTTIFGAALLLVTELLRPDLVGLLVIITLSLTKVISAEQAFSGFSQSAVMTILSVFIISEAMQRSGITRWIGQRLVRLAGKSERRLIAALSLTAALLSTVMKPIASTAALMPTTMGIARQVNLRPSRLLMPLVFGALLGGTATLLTTANIIVSITLSQTGHQPFGMLDFLPIGIPLTLAGVLFLIIAAPRLLPTRDIAGQFVRMRRLQNELVGAYGLKDQYTEVEVSVDSQLHNHSLEEIRWGSLMKSGILGIARKNSIILAPDASTVLQTGDILLLDSEPSSAHLNLFNLELVKGIDIDETFGTEETPLVEAALSPHSSLHGRSMRDLNFRQRYGLQVLAVWREGKVLSGPVRDIPLRFGDAILLQGYRPQIEQLDQDPDFIILEEETNANPPRKSWLAFAVLFGCLFLGAINVIPLAVATLTGATLMVLLGVLAMDEAYRTIDWRTIFLVAGMLPVSIALENTGLAHSIGLLMISSFSGFGPLGIAAILMSATIGLSIFLGGQTAGVILAPIAIAAAEAAGIDPRALAMAVAVGCSMAFISPLSHPALLLVIGPGGYTFRDYLRLGLPLTLVSILVALAFLQWVWL